MQLIAKLNGTDTIPSYGPLPISVPGCVDAWFMLHEVCFRGMGKLYCSGAPLTALPLFLAFVVTWLIAFRPPAYGAAASTDDPVRPRRIPCRPSRVALLAQVVDRRQRGSAILA